MESGELIKRLQDAGWQIRGGKKPMVGAISLCVNQVSVKLLRSLIHAKSYPKACCGKLSRLPGLN